MVNILCRLHHNNASRKVRDRGTNYCLHLYTFIRAQYLHNKSGKFYFKQSEIGGQPFSFLVVSVSICFSLQCPVQSTNSQTCKWTPNGLFTYITLHWRAHTPATMIITK